MIGIEVDGDDLRRIGGQIIENVAAARGDGDQPMVGLEIERLQIDVGVFPDLVIHKPLKHKGEQALQHAALGVGGPLMGGAFEKQIGHGVFAESPCVFAWRKGVYLGWNGTAEQRDSFETRTYAAIEAVLREQMTAG